MNNSERKKIVKERKQDDSACLNGDRKRGSLLGIKDEVGVSQLYTVQIVK